MKELTEDQFEEAIASNDIVLLDFWAPWCSPCKALVPILNLLEEENAGKIGVFSVNTDSETALPNRFVIRSIPTILFFKKGVLLQRVVGMKSRVDLQKEIDLLEGDSE